MLFISISAYGQDSRQTDTWQQQIDAGIAAVEDYQLDEGATHFRHALEMTKDLGPRSMRLFESRVRYAEVCARSGSCDEEMYKDAYFAAYMTREMVNHDEPKEDDRYAELLMLLSDAAQFRERPEESIKYSREALALLQKRKVPGDPRVASAYKHLAWTLDAAEEHSEAREMMNQGIAIFDEAPKVDVEAKALFLESSAALYVYQSDQGDLAEKDFQRALDIREEAWGDQDIRFLDALSRVIGELRDEVYEDLAPDVLDRLIARSVALRLRKHGEKSPLYWESLEEQAAYYLDSDQLVIATERYQELYRVVQRYPAEHEQKRMLSVALVGLANVFARRDDNEQAVKYGEEGIRLEEEEQELRKGNDRFKASPYNTRSRLHRLLSKTYLEMARHEDSERHFNRYASLLRKDYPRSVGTLADDLGALYMERKQYERAIPKLEEAAATQEATATGQAYDMNSSPETLQRLSEAYTATGRHEDANRVNIVLMQAKILNASKDAANMTTWVTILASVLVAFGALCMLGILGGIGYYYFRRKLLREIDQLYVLRQTGEPMPASGPATGSTVGMLAKPLGDLDFASERHDLPVDGTGITTLEQASEPPNVYSNQAHGAEGEQGPVVETVSLSVLAADVIEDTTPGRDVLGHSAVTASEPAHDAGLPPITGADDLGTVALGTVNQESVIQDAGNKDAMDREIDTLPDSFPAPEIATRLAPPPPPLLVHAPGFSSVAGTPRNTLSAEPHRIGLAFSGDGFTLFSLRVRNLLITLLTLGVYSFWGKALVRRYLIGEISVGQDRLAFHGTGKELLLGWLRASPFLALIIFLPNILPLLWKTPNAIIVGQLIVFGAIGLLLPIARAGAYRYRLNRTSWRGIRFTFQGSTMRMLKLYLQAYLLIPLTVGLYTPYFVMRTEREQLGNSFFGDRSFQFNGKGSQLLPCFACSLPLGILSFGLFWPWYRALRSQYIWANTTYGDARFRSHATGLGLLGLWVGNLAILFFTLGLGASWTLTRTLRFWSQHIEVVGDPQLDSVRQSAASTNAAGESFTDFLGFEFGV